jgi:hypothetical protein
MWIGESMCPDGRIEGKRRFEALRGEGDRSSYGVCRVVDEFADVKGKQWMSR